MGRRRHGGRAIGPRLSRVTKAAGAHPPGRGRGEADRVGFDLINARIPPARGVSARRHVLALELPQLSNRRAAPPPPGAARHAEGGDETPNPQDTAGPRGGETQQGHGDPGREADEKQESERRRARAAQQTEEGAAKGDGEGPGPTHATTVRAEGPHHASSRPVTPEHTHPHHHTRDLTASTLRGQGRSRGMGRRHLTRPTGGRRASATASQHASSRGENHRPPPPVTDRPQPHKAPTGTRGAEPSKSPPSPGGGEGERPSPPRQRGGVGAAPGPRRARHRRREGEDAGIASGHKSRTPPGKRTRDRTATRQGGPATARDTGARLRRPSASSPTRTREPRRRGASTRRRQQPHTPNGPRAASRPANRPDPRSREAPRPRGNAPQGRPRGRGGREGWAQAQHTCRPPPR
ncbi:basic salivary proline-rich protein 2-like [Lepus europaeus]|uniref:basic salivary proline-rich protein 2-like n=1 Tax=Lepus europaeus TaxID=9983 RepID=UPI002B484E05|nr:basic salivary proline-rich protein 2-like [Lepus europaeus]XP_062040941.1 basic salivary proline-rich protein 2-like [Lepus europaeus]